MTITLIAAVAENRVIGRDGVIPWNLPEDRKRFRMMTMGHPLIMGRRTFQSLPRPLDGRTIIVLSRNRHFTATDGNTATSLEEALALAEYRVQRANGTFVPVSHAQARERLGLPRR